MNDTDELRREIRAEISKALVRGMFISEGYIAKQDTRIDDFTDEILALITTQNKALLQSLIDEQ